MTEIYKKRYESGITLFYVAAVMPTFLLLSFVAIVLEMIFDADMMDPSTEALTAIIGVTAVSALVLSVLCLFTYPPASVPCAVWCGLLSVMTMNGYVMDREARFQRIVEEITGGE